MAPGFSRGSHLYGGNECSVLLQKAQRCPCLHQWSNRHRPSLTFVRSSSCLASCRPSSAALTFDRASPKDPIAIRFAVRITASVLTLTIRACRRVGGPELRQIPAELQGLLGTQRWSLIRLLRFAQRRSLQVSHCVSLGDQIPPRYTVARDEARRQFE